MFTYEDLELKYGPILANYCLIEIERASNIKSHSSEWIDPEARLIKAIRAQDERIAQCAA